MVDELDGAEGTGEKFSPELRERLLLWCGRHCCLCGKACGLFIEVHHIVPRYKGGSSVPDNALPVCFDCHGTLSHYDDRQPKGTKYRPDELKKRRDQIYEENTRSLVPALEYKVHGEKGTLVKRLPDGTNEIHVLLRQLPDVGFRLYHPGGAPSVRVFVKLDTYLDGQPTPSRADGLYGGKQAWNLNPGEGVNGHFEVPSGWLTTRDLRVVVNLTVLDRYEYEHVLLPVTWVFQADEQAGPNAGVWWLDPVGADVIHERIAERFNEGRIVK